jgi:multiple sugar transport system substrate-binding protein
MSNYRRLIGVGVVAAALLSTAACGGVASSSSHSGPTGTVAKASGLSNCVPSKYTLKLNFGPQAAQAVKLATTEMQQKYPGLKFDASPSSSTNYSDLTKQVTSDAAVGKPDDLIDTGLSQLRFWVDSYHPAALDQSKLPAGYQKQFLAAGMVDGKAYAAPFQVSAPVILVNQTLLKKAGINPNTRITSYAQFVKDAQTLTAKTGKPSVNLSTDSLPDWFAQGLVQSAGGTFVDPDGTAGFGSPTGLSALGLWTSLAKGKNLLNIGLLDAAAQFAAGNLPFYFATTAQVAAAQKEVGNKFAWMPVDPPTPNGKVAGPLPAGGNGWLVLSQDSCKAAYAKQMIDLMLSKNISLQASGTSFSYVPVNSDAAAQLLRSSSATPQLKYAWSYTKPLTVWGGFKGSATAQILDVLATMTQQLATGQDTKSTVDTAVTKINGLVGH